MVLVDSVHGIGRNTARSIASRLNDVASNPQNDWGRTGATIMDDLHSFLHDELDGDRQMFKDYALEQAKNVGQVRRERLMEFIDEWEPGSHQPVGVTKEMLEEGDYAGTIDETVDDADVAFEPANSDSNARLSDFT
jgi:uncharacterized protein (DUF885 family)